MKTVSQEIDLGGRKLILEHGRFADLANSAIVARYGDTMVLVTCVSSLPKETLGYFPLFVEYQERLYAGGRIKGSRWVKREGRPSDEGILAGRLIDRSIRPLFPDGYKKEVQVVATVLSVDIENDPEILAVVGASAALATSNIPWRGPLAALRIGAKNGTYFVNPTSSELKFSDLDLVLATQGEHVIMLEAGAGEVSEEKVLEAIKFGQKEAEKIIAGISQLSEKVGVKKEPFDKPNQELVARINKKFAKDIDSFAARSATKEGGLLQEELKSAIAEAVGEENIALANTAFEKALRGQVREKILSGTRADGRKNNDVRPVEGSVGILPRTHGSAVFKRGQTQVLSATTLGSPSLEQLIETAQGEETKRYIHHYSMPPYSTGETGRMGYPSRREIGHGALAERALLPVIPSEDKFPYTIRVVSEVLASNGSTSMGSVCASTMSLMDAGVPIAAPVAGIAMGLVIEKGRVEILSDIAGIEDGAGDMDFKVAGSKRGITAVQLDVKTEDLTVEILAKALDQAKEGRLFILDKMLAIIDKPSAQVSRHAPKIAVVSIPKDKIGEVIGPGGQTVRKIMAQTGTTIDIEDEEEAGSVAITGSQQEQVDQAKEWIEGLVKEVKPGEIYEGEVVRIQPFGAFVRVTPGKDGLVHISDMSERFVKDPLEIVEVGQKVKVKVKEIDNMGRINLTMLLSGEKKERPTTPAPRRGESWPRQSFARGRRMSERRKNTRGGGPHFPASRYLPSKKRF